VRGAQLAFAGFLFWLVVVACSGSESEPPVAQVRSALTTSLIATKDSEVDEGHPHPSYGAATSMGVHGKTVRAIVAFDAQAVSRLSSSDARVELTIVGAASSNWGAQGRTVGIFTLTHDWSELGATARCSDDSDTSNDAADCSGPTAWDMRLGSSPHPWVEPATSTTIIKKGQTGTVVFDVSADLARFRSGTPNFGWLIMKDLGENGNAGDVEFSTRTTSTPPLLVGAALMSTTAASAMIGTAGSAMRAPKAKEAATQRLRGAPTARTAAPRASARPASARRQDACSATGRTEAAARTAIHAR